MAFALPACAATALSINVAGAQAQWNLVEELRIGTGDSEPHTFTDIRGIAVGTGGRILVLDYKVQEIRMFDAAGTFLKLAARRGQGPGEISTANGLAQGADGTIWVNDPANSRFSLFKPDGSFLRQHIVPIRSYGFIWNGTVDARGRVNDPLFIDTSKGDVAMRIRRIGPDGATGDSLDISCRLARSPVAPWIARSKNGQMGMAVPFTASASIRLDPRGFAWCTPGDVYRVARVRLGGSDTLAVAERRIEPVAVTAAERAAVIARTDSALKQYETNNVDYSQMPRVKPFIEGLEVDDAGRLWVRRPAPDRTITVFDVFDEGGRFLATVRAPFRIDPYRHPVIRGDVVHVVVIDDDDVQNVVRARIRR